MRVTVTPEGNLAYVQGSGDLGGPPEKAALSAGLLRTLIRLEPWVTLETIGEAAMVWTNGCRESMLLLR
jgi:hypothetical protein